MDQALPILVVSCRPENRRMLMRVFEGLPIDSYSAPSIQQAREAMSHRSFSVVFCEERLPDGTYADLLAYIRLSIRTAPDSANSPAGLSEDTRFVVMLCTGEWEEYLEALRLGAEEVLRWPLQPTDVDLALIHTMRGASHRRELASRAHA